MEETLFEFSKSKFLQVISCIFEEQIIQKHKTKYSFLFFEVNSTRCVYEIKS